MLVGLARALQGDAGGLAELRTAVAMGRDAPRFLLPTALGMLAYATRDGDERAAALAEGDRLLAEDTVSHNRIWFNRFALETALAIGDPAAARRYAAALQRASKEPLPYLEFLAHRGRLLADRLEGRLDRAACRELHDRAAMLGWNFAQPALAAALAGD